MTDFSKGYPKGQKNQSKKTTVIALISVFAVIFAMLVVFLFTKNNIFYSVARKRAENQDFVSAVSVLKKSESENSEILRQYLDLRIDINRSYPVLLSEYDAQKISLWKQTADYLTSYNDILGEKIAFEVLSLSQILGDIVNSHNEYTAMKADILEMMDVFCEINRLHSKGADGKNISFTTAEERAKIQRWTELSDKLLSFSAATPGSEDIYLLNFLAKESQSEISEVTKVIDSVEADGYAETDLVRFSGEAHKVFPDINNGGGESVNLADKYNFEKFMYEEFCMGLAGNLAPYYITGS